MQTVALVIGYIFIAWCCGILGLVSMTWLLWKFRGLMKGDDCSTCKYITFDSVCLGACSPSYGNKIYWRHRPINNCKIYVKDTTKKEKV
jgi:hypothetical protein